MRGGSRTFSGHPPTRANAERKRAPLACQDTTRDLCAARQSSAARLRLRQLGSLRRKSVIRAARPQQSPVPATKDERPLWLR